MRSCLRWALAASQLASFVYAGTVDVQDNDPGMVYSGFWLEDPQPFAHGGFEHWTNQTGASVYYDFKGEFPVSS